MLTVIFLSMICLIARATTTERVIPLPIIMFSGPSQGSTLMSEAFIKGLNLKRPINMIEKFNCGPEFFNPGCSRDRKILEKCFGANGASNAIWKTCSSIEFENALDLARKDGFQFAKENFANGFQLSQFHRKGFSVFVAFRRPLHTFPSPGANRFYLHIWDRLVSTSNADLMLLPFGAEVIKLRNYAVKMVYNDDASEKGGVKGLERQCLAHFIHFWHLFSVAIEENIPVVNMERLLLVNSDQKLQLLENSGVCSLKAIGGRENCIVFLQTLEHLSRGSINAHRAPTRDRRGNFSTTQEMYREREKEFQNTKCQKALGGVIRFCRRNSANCVHIIEIYLGRATFAYNFTNHTDTTSQRSSIHGNSKLGKNDEMVEFTLPQTSAASSIVSRNKKTIAKIMSALFSLLLLSFIATAW